MVHVPGRKWDMNHEEAHEFAPIVAETESSAAITARCTCGWEGGTYQAEQDGYAEAIAEFDLHAAGRAVERDDEEPLLHR
jgi:hypothetical protein